MGECWYARPMPDELRVSIPFSAGSLSGRLAAAVAPSLAAVVCHPHPAYGGHMYNNVVLALRDGFAAANAAVLRFDFRGVGSSDGESAGGAEEVDDVLAAAAWMSESHPGVPLVLAGYSFGAVMALRAARPEEVRGLLLVAPPTAMLAADELGLAAMTMLIVVGDRDGFCPLADLHALTADRVPTSVIHGADHFFSGFEDEVSAAASAFCRALAAAT
jgi:alpha/beta superfamily hydrolase